MADLVGDSVRGRDRVGLGLGLERWQALGGDEAVLDPGDDNFLVEIAAQLEEIVVRIPLIDLDQRTWVQRRGPKG